MRAEELFEQSENVLDMTDIERVHDMRVASRRLRAVLEIYAPCFPREQFRPLLREVKALADALGARRDPDVLLDRLREIEDDLPRTDARGVEVVRRSPCTTSSCAATRCSPTALERRRARQTCADACRARRRARCRGSGEQAPPPSPSPQSARRDAAAVAVAPEPDGQAA